MAASKGPSAESIPLRIRASGGPSAISGSEKPEAQSSHSRYLEEHRRWSLSPTRWGRCPRTKSSDQAKPPSLHMEAFLQTHCEYSLPSDHLSGYGLTDKQSSEPSMDLTEVPDEETSHVDTTPSYFTQKPVYSPSEHTLPHSSPEGGNRNGKAGSKGVTSSGSKDSTAPNSKRVTAPYSYPAHKSLRKRLMMKIPRLRKDSLSSSTVSPTSSSREKWTENSTPSSPASSSSFGQFNRQGTNAPLEPSILTRLGTNKAQSTCRARLSRILQV